MLNDTYDPNTDPNVNPNWFDWGTTPTPSSPGYDGYGGHGDYGNGGGIDWNNILNLSYGLGSQVVQAYGHNPTQQIGGYSTLGVGGGYSPAANNQSAAQLAAALNARNTGYVPVGGTVNQPGAIVNTGSLMQLIQKNGTVIAVGLVALMLFKSGRK